MIRTEAWVIHRGEPNVRAELTLEEIEFEDPAPDEVVVAPLYGCWEGNMSHALRRKPIDICRVRLESPVVLGNAGVVRVMQQGPEVQDLSPGDVCLLLPVGKADEHGYLTHIFGYDCPGTIGLLAKRTKLKRHQLFRIPQPSRHSLRQWSGVSVRYITAYDNWRVAKTCYRSQLSGAQAPAPWVWAWGGGVALAELQLAAAEGHPVAMVASTDARLRQIEAAGILPVDRRAFPDLRYDPSRYRDDSEYRATYLRSESQFLRTVRSVTGGQRVGIFIDNVGAPVHRATLRALARQGVVTTAGWDQGGSFEFNRIEACISRHLLINTHGNSIERADEACRFIANSDWIPPKDPPTWAWEDIPDLAQRFTEGEIDSYFPTFEVNRDLL